MKKRYKQYIWILLILVVLVIIINGIGNVFNMKNKMTPKKIFGINEKEYKVIEKKDELLVDGYGGEYSMKLEIKEKQMDNFVNQIIEEARYTYIITYEDLLEYLNTEGKDEFEINDGKTDYEQYKKLIEMLTDKDISEIDTIYRYAGAAKRFVFNYMGYYGEARGWIIVSKCNDEKYDVCLYYYEWVTD